MYKHAAGGSVHVFSDLHVSIERPEENSHTPMTHVSSHMYYASFLADILPQGLVSVLYHTYLVRVRVDLINRHAVVQLMNTLLKIRVNPITS